MATVEELRVRAGELEIEGRSGMSKADLEAAIAVAEGAHPENAQVRVEEATERGIDGEIDLARHVTAADVPKEDPTAEDGGPFKLRDVPDSGAMEFVYNGVPYAPVACGAHRSAEAAHAPEGFDPDCEACAEQFSMIVEHIRRVA